MTRMRVLVGLALLAVLAGGAVAQRMDTAAGGVVVRTVGTSVNPSAMDVDERSGRVFVTSLGPTDAAGTIARPGRVSVLDARSGRLLRTITTGWYPAGVLVDARAGRALVLNSGGSSVVPWSWLPLWLPLVPRQQPPCRQPGQRLCRPFPGSVTVLDVTR